MMISANAYENNRMNRRQQAKMESIESLNEDIKIEYVAPLDDLIIKIPSTPPRRTLIVTESELDLEEVKFESDLKFEEPTLSLCREKSKPKKSTEKTKEHKCFLCGYQTKYKSHLNTHLSRVHMGEKKNECNECSKKFFDKNQLSRHMKVHTGEKTHECHICSKLFAEKGNLNQHLEMHAKKNSTDPLPKFECYICSDGIQYKYIGNLRNHMPLHDKNDEKPSTCDICSESFLYEPDLKRHMRKHSKVPLSAKTFKCSICSYATKYKSHLTEHVRRHSGEKPYACNQCEKKFTSSSHLYRHVKQLHTNIRLHECKICSKKYSDRATLTQHIKWKHTDAKPKKFECSICSVSHVSASNLKVHMRIHTGERPHKCTLCTKTFVIKTNLLRHLQSHSNGNIQAIPKKLYTYECYVCASVQETRYGLIEHFRKHTGEIPLKLTKRHECHLCPNHFATKKSLNKHLEMHALENVLSLFPISKPSKYECYICAYACMSRGSIKAHFRKHTGNEYHCKVCDKSFVRKDHLKSHMFSHTGEKPFKCSECPKKYSQISHLNFHKRKSHKLRNISSKCPLKINGHSNSNKKTSITCCNCSFSTIFNDTLVQHMKIHQFSFKCSVKLDSLQLKDYAETVSYN